MPRTSSRSFHSGLVIFATGTYLKSMPGASGSSELTGMYDLLDSVYAVFTLVRHWNVLYVARETAVAEVFTYKVVKQSH